MLEGQERAEKGKSLDQMMGHLRAAEAVGEEKWLRWLGANWERLAWSFALVLLVVWLVNGFRTSALRSEQQASLEFSRMQKLFAPNSEGENALPKLDEKQSRERFQSLQSTIDILKKNYPDTIYAELSGIYQALSLMEQGKNEEARQTLKSYQVDLFQGKTKAEKATSLNDQQFIHEVASYVYAKTFLQESNLVEARTRLLGIVRGGAMLNLEALISLSRIASSTEEQNEVTAVAKELSIIRPELSSQIKQNLSSEGYVL